MVRKNEIASGSEFIIVKNLILKARDKRKKLGEQFCFLKKPATLNEWERNIFHNAEYMVNIDDPFTQYNLQVIGKRPLLHTDMSKLKTALESYLKKRK